MSDDKHDELERLRTENRALRTALIQVCTDAASGWEDRRRTNAIREAANHLSEPFSWEKAQRIYDSEKYVRIASDDLAALRWLARRVGKPPWNDEQKRALAVLDRLLEQSK